MVFLYQKIVLKILEVVICSGNLLYLLAVARQWPLLPTVARYVLDKGKKEGLLSRTMC